mgnify:CR=1 FL=1
MPPLDDEDRKLLAECRMDFFVGPGPGGQHRNKTESAVRLVHLTTGITVTATERRSQHQNLAAAIERLRQRLATLRRPKKARRPTRPGPAARARRVEAKRRRGTAKSLRRHPGDDD